MALALTAGCEQTEPDAAGPGAAAERDTAAVLLALTAAPADALCHKAMFTSSAPPVSFERTFDRTVGATTPVSLADLPSGTFTLTVNAFAQTCAVLPVGAAPTWMADPVSVALSPGTTAGAALFLRRPPAANVVFDYDTASIVYVAPGGGSIRGLAVQGSSLFVADTAQIVRLPETGGGATTVAMSAGITAIGADANNLVWSAGIMFRGPTTGFGVPRVLINTGASSLSVVNGLVIALDVAAVRAIPVTLATPSSPTAVFGTMITAVTADATNAYFADGSFIHRQVLTSPGGIPGIPVTSTGSSPARDLASDGTTLFYVTTDALRRIPVGGGTLTTMVTFFPAPITLVMVDASNVYLLTAALTSSAPPQCLGATLSRLTKTGVVATPVWSRAGLCPNRLAQSATGLFLADTAAGWVRRLPK